jgi:dephospho-CoA kinase
MSETRPFYVGLTGGIAAGKSEVQRMLSEQGVPVLDTDRVAHEVMRSGTGVYHKIIKQFGPVILGCDGEIDRKILGAIVFSNEKERQKLNQIVHPEVGRQWRSWLASQQGRLAVVSIPLLYECGLQNHFDGILCVWAPESLMRKRLLGRGLTEQQADQRIQSQWPVDQKKEASTWSVINESSLEDLKSQVHEWLRQFS